MEEREIILARMKAREDKDKLEAEQYWQNTYPALPYEDRKKVWERDLWGTVRGGGYELRNLDFINKDYVDLLKEKEPDIVRIYDEMLQISYYLEEEFGEGTIELIRQRIKS